MEIALLTALKTRTPKNTLTIHGTAQLRGYRCMGDDGNSSHAGQTHTATCSISATLSSSHILRSSLGTWTLYIFSMSASFTDPSVASSYASCKQHQMESPNSPPQQEICIPLGFLKPEIRSPTPVTLKHSKHKCKIAPL